MARSKRILVLLALAPFVLLTARGRRLHPRLPAAVALAALVGIIVGSVSLYVMLRLLNGGPGPPAYGRLFIFVFVIQPTLMGLAETLTAAKVIGRAGPAFFAAMMGHVLWCLVLLPVITEGLFAHRILVDQYLVMALLIIVPAAFLGAAGAGLGAALASR
jgi:hypothetical protein